MGSFNKAFEELTIGELRKLHEEYLQLNQKEEKKWMIKAT